MISNIEDNIHSNNFENYQRNYKLKLLKELKHEVK